MNGALKALIAVTCVCVIGAVGWYAMEQKREADARAEMRAAMERAESEEDYRECLEIIRTDARGYGNQSDAMLNACNAIVELYERRE